MIPLLSYRLLHPGYQNNQILGRLNLINIWRHSLNPYPIQEVLLITWRTLFSILAVAQQDHGVWSWLNFISDLTRSVALTWFLSLNTPSFLPLWNIHICCFFAWNTLLSLHMADILSFKTQLTHFSRRLFPGQWDCTPTPTAVILSSFFHIFFLWVAII